MNKSYLIIILIIIIVGAGLFYWLTGNKQCTDLNEQECKKDDSCLSVLVPCTGADCTSSAVFTECKDKD